MKKQTQLYYFLFLVLVLSACGTDQLFISAVRQPDIRVSEDIVKIVAVDRSRPAQQAISVLEGLVTGEHIGQDAWGRKKVFSSLNEVMNDQDRFELILSGMELEGSSTGGTMKEPLPTKKIKGIARKFEADAVLVLESFDSDTRSPATNIIQAGSVLNTGIDPIAYPNNVRTGWRLYNAHDGSIIDEFQTFMRGNGWWAFANHPSFVDREEVMNAADASAFQMAGRIIPVEVFFERLYYRNAGLSNRELKQAQDFVQARRMDRAGEIWHDLYHSDENRKVRGRAAFNLAVWYENDGDFLAAMDWIERSIELGNNRAVEYGRLLEERQRMDAVE